MRNERSFRPEHPWNERSVQPTGPWNERSFRPNPCGTGRHGLQALGIRPSAEDLPETLESRIRVVLLKKQPAYAKVAKWFDETTKASDVVPV